MLVQPSEFDVAMGPAVQYVQKIKQRCDAETYRQFLDILARYQDPASTLNQVSSLLSGSRTFTSLHSSVSIVQTILTIPPAGRGIKADRLIIQRRPGLKIRLQDFHARAGAALPGGQHDICT